MLKIVSGNEVKTDGQRYPQRRVMPTGDHEGRIFLSHPHTNNGFFLAHHWLMVSYCDRWMSVVRRQQLLQTTSTPKLLAGF